MSTTLKQVKLEFTSAKRTTSSSKIGKPNATTSTTTLKPAPKEITSTKSKTSEKNNHDEILLSSSDDDIPEEFDEIETVSTKSDVETLGGEDEEEIEDAPTPPPVERKTRSSTKKTPSKNAPQAKVGPSTETAKVGMFRVSNARPEDVAKKVEANARKEDEGDAPELNYKDPKWRKHHNEVKEKMGHMHTIHGEKQNKIHDILRVFDNSYEYGPCVGVSRRDRWNRAQALGLNPPKEVDDILNTKQGLTMPEYSQSVFYGEV